MVSFCQSYLWAKRTPSFAFAGSDWLAQRSRTFFAFPACAVASEIIRIKEQVRSSGLLHGSSVLGLGLTILALAPHSGVLGISCRILSTSLASRLGLLHICATHPCLAMGRRTRARIIYRCRVYRPFHTMAQPCETLSLVTKQEPRRN